MYDNIEPLKYPWYKKYRIAKLNVSNSLLEDISGYQIIQFIRSNTNIFLIFHNKLIVAKIFDQKLAL